MTASKKVSERPFARDEHSPLASRAHRRRGRLAIERLQLDRSISQEIHRKQRTAELTEIDQCHTLEAMAKKTANYRLVAMGEFVRRDEIVRLSDPDKRTAVRKHVRELTKSKDSARQFLKDIGIVTPTGRLTKRYGG